MCICWEIIVAIGLLSKTSTLSILTQGFVKEQRLGYLPASSITKLLIVANWRQHVGEANVSRTSAGDTL